MSRRGGFPYSHITLSQNVNIFVKTKNAQEALKHKINLKIFFVTWAFPYWGGGGGSDNVGKIPTFYRFLSDPGVPGVRSMGPDVSH